MPPFKAACLALGLAIGALPPAPASAERNGGVHQEPTADKAQELAALMSRALVPARLPEIYADLRRSVREVYLPALRDTLRGDRPDQPPLDADQRDALAKVADLFEYSLRASDELEPFLAENRNAIILDVATLQAKYLSLAEIHALGELLDMPAMRKIFNAVYAASRLFTGYSYEDMRSYYAQSAWLGDLKSTLKDHPLMSPDTPPPSAEKLAKATAIITDFMRVSRLDEMLQDIIRFARDVQPESGKASEGKGKEQEAQNQIEWLEFFYNLEKSMMLSAGPPTLAAMFTDKQLDQLHLLILSPVMTKTFGLLQETVRAATSLTRQDIQSLKTFSETAEKNGLFKKRTKEEEQQLKQETEALGQIWRDRAWNYLKPETREGLSRAIRDVQKLEEERSKPDDRDNDDNGEVEGERRL